MCINGLAEEWPFQILNTFGELSQEFSRPKFKSTIIVNRWGKLRKYQWVFSKTVGSHLTEANRDRQVIFLGRLKSNLKYSIKFGSQVRVENKAQQFYHIPRAF